jgi:hypothetical protein
MRRNPIKVIESKVEGTSRQRVITDSGVVLDRQPIYLKAEAWNALADLSREQGVSGSIVIARLIWQASKHNPDIVKPINDVLEEFLNAR